MKRIEFTYEYLNTELAAMIDAGYAIISCIDYLHYKKAGTLAPKTIVLRVDVDLSLKKAERLLNIFSKLNIKATFFIRLHAPEYNPFSFENYRIVKEMIRLGHEIGYHSEVIDEAHIWNENAEDCLVRDIAVFNTMFGVTIRGVASHGGMTGLNNLDFWKNRIPAEFNLLYEGYDKEHAYNIFQEAFYVSDSEWVRWKCYDKGVKMEGDHRSPSEHTADNRPLIHLLVHPDTYYKSNFYDNEK
ncbi:MAG: polysaccharide deacetylase family protein [Bacteroidota bacterium]